MKKILIIIILFIVLMFATQMILLAHHQNRAPASFLNIYKNDGIIAAGLKQHVFNQIYATTNIQYLDSASDLEFQAGAAYLFPYKILFFRLYGGTGLQMSRNEGFQYPYIVMGTDFLIFFSEVIHPLSSHMEPKFRAGFSFHF